MRHIFLILFLLVAVGNAQFSQNVRVLNTPTVLVGDTAKTSIIGEQNAPMAQDASTEAATVISYEHHEIHAGHHYFIRGYKMIGSGDTVAFSISTPDTTEWTHMVFQVTGSLITQVYMFAEATVSAGDTITAHNSNRNYLDNYGGVVRSDPTISVEGVCIDSSAVGAGGGSKFGGSVSRSNEIVLKQGKSYIWYLISGSASNYVSWNVEFYEHTDRN